VQATKGALRGGASQCYLIVFHILIGYGIDLTNTNCVTTLAEYSKPLINYL